LEDGLIDNTAADASVLDEVRAEWMAIISECMEIGTFM
jgi:hypothetical protein